MVCQIVDRQKDIVISYQKARQYLEMNQLINREELIAFPDGLSKQA
jgi:hypothetical protein